jgi:hypothetical protein
MYSGLFFYHKKRTPQYKCRFAGFNALFLIQNKASLFMCFYHTLHYRGNNDSLLICKGIEKKPSQAQRLREFPRQKRAETAQ